MGYFETYILVSLSTQEAEEELRVYIEFQDYTIKLCLKKEKRKREKRRKATFPKPKIQTIHFQT